MLHWLLEVVLHPLDPSHAPVKKSGDPFLALCSPLLLTLKILEIRQSPEKVHLGHREVMRAGANAS